MDPQEPDITALAERLGMRGIRYRSFGNPPYRGERRPAPVQAREAAPPPPGPMMAAQPAPVAPLPHAPGAAGWPSMAHPGLLPQPMPAYAPAPAYVPAAPPAPSFPLIAQALAAAATPSPAGYGSAGPGGEPPPAGTLPFLALRAAVRGAGD